MTDYSEIIGSKLIVDESITNVDLNAYFARNDSIALQVKVAGIDEPVYLIVDMAVGQYMVKLDSENTVTDIAESVGAWGNSLWVFENSGASLYLEDSDEKLLHFDEEKKLSNTGLLKGTLYNVKKTLIKDVVYGTKKGAYLAKLDVDVEITCSDDSFKERCSEQYSDNLTFKYRTSNYRGDIDIPIVKGVSKLGPNVKLKMENGQLVFVLNDNIIPFKTIKHHFVTQDLVLGYGFLIKAYVDGLIGDEFDGSFTYYHEDDKHCLVGKV